MAVTDRMYTGNVRALEGVSAYDILGLNKDASQADITKAYRQRVMAFHPDRNPGDAIAAEKFKKIDTAYQVLKEAETRAEYDKLKQSKNRPNSSAVDEYDPIKHKEKRDGAQKDEGKTEEKKEQKSSRRTAEPEKPNARTAASDAEIINKFNAAPSDEGMIFNMKEFAEASVRDNMRNMRSGGDFVEKKVVSRSGGSSKVFQFVGDAAKLDDLKWNLKIAGVESEVRFSKSEGKMVLQVDAEAMRNIMPKEFEGVDLRIRPARAKQEPNREAEPKREKPGANKGNGEITAEDIQREKQAARESARQKNEERKGTGRAPIPEDISDEQAKARINARRKDPDKFNERGEPKANGAPRDKVPLDQAKAIHDAKEARNDRANANREADKAPHENTVKSEPKAPEPPKTAAKGPTPEPAASKGPAVAAPKATGLTTGNNAAAAATGIISTVNAVKEGDVGGIILGTTSTGVGVLGTAAEVAALRGSTGALATTGGAIARKAALPVAIVTAGYDVYKEEGTSKDDKADYKMGRAAAGAVTIGAGVATGAAVAGATVAGVGVAGVAGAVLAPIAAAVAVGWAANAMVDVSKGYSVEDRRFAANQDNRNIEVFSHSLMGGTAAENAQRREGFKARGAKFAENGQFDLNDPRTRDVVREELEAKKAELRETIRKSDGWVVSPRYNPFASSKRVDRFNIAKTDLSALEGATTELDNYAANRAVIDAKRAEQAKVTAAAEAKVKGALDVLDKNKDGTFDIKDLDRNGDGKIDLADYAHKDGQKKGLFDRESLAELNKDIAAIAVLAERDPRQAPLLEGLRTMAKEADQALTNQEKIAAQMTASLEKVKPFDRNKDGAITLEDYYKDGKFTAESLKEMKDDVKKIEALAKDDPNLATVRDGMKKLTEQAERDLKAQEEKKTVTTETPAPTPAAPVVPEGTARSAAPAALTPSAPAVPPKGPAAEAPKQTGSQNPIMQFIEAIVALFTGKPAPTSQVSTQAPAATQGTAPGRDNGRAPSQEASQNVTPKQYQDAIKRLHNVATPVGDHLKFKPNVTKTQMDQAKADLDLVCKVEAQHPEVNSAHNIKSNRAIRNSLDATDLAMKTHGKPQGVEQRSGDTFVRAPTGGQKSVPQNGQTPS